MQRKWMLIVGGIAVVAVLLVAVQLFTTRGATSTPTTAPADSQSSAGQPSTDVSPGVASHRIDPLPGGKPLPAIAPTGIPRPGVRLHPLRSSPPSLISGFKAGKVPDGSAYAVVVSPWGYGPTQAQGQTVVVTIVAATPVGAAPNASGLKRRTLLAVMDQRAGGAVIVSGNQKGTLTFVRVGENLIPTLSAIESPTP
jgi:hypothetical protein